MNIDLLREKYSLETKKGIGYILAAIIFWAAMIPVGIFESNILRIICYFVGGTFIFPLGLLMSKLMKALGYTDKTLGALGGILNIAQFLYYPLVWGAIFYKIEAFPWFLAVISGAHLLPYGWLYRSKAYVFSSIAITISSTVIGIRFQDQTYTVIPILMAFLLFPTFLWLKAEISQLELSIKEQTVGKYGEVGNSR